MGNFVATDGDFLVARDNRHVQSLLDRLGNGIAGHETDETTQRGIWRHYREVMSR